MRVFTACKDLPADCAGAVTAIGNFDGVHRGHQALLAEAANIARREKRPLAVLTFEPHPRRLFQPDAPPFRITPTPVKARRLAAAGVELLFSLPFDWDFASQGAEEFIDTVLTRGIRPAHVVVGNDFRFGQLRKGTPETIRAAGIPVAAIGRVGDAGGAPFSSSRIRAALEAGDIAAANALLGWRWEIEGIVAHGDKRGRELGFPTANVPLGDTLHPAYGIYAALVQVEGEKHWRPSATNIGIRPMFELSVGQVEAHLLDFSGDLYGKTLRIRPVKRLRGEARYDTLDALVAQIAEDCRQTRAALASAAEDPDQLDM
jgi:riboflavin kinase/FMN adenylyltransferase